MGSNRYWCYGFGKTPNSCTRLYNDISMFTFIQINDTTLKQKLKEVEDKLKQEHEYQKQKLLEEQKKQFIAEKEALEQEVSGLVLVSTLQHN